MEFFRASVRNNPDDKPGAEDVASEFCDFFPHREFIRNVRCFANNQGAGAESSP
ncbi:MAG: hypothetical protein JWM11_25 [Planctomycetaceae bacterium]|nr:hypothetical protein [Planctomycetaceae bacterium]